MKTKNRLTFFTLVAATLIFASSSAQAAYDIFMQATGLTGESTSASHPQWTEVYSISFGVANSTDVTSPTPEPGIPQVSSINLMKKADKTSPLLIQNCNLGTEMTTITIDFEKVGLSTPVVFYKITLEGAVITSVQQSGAAGGDDTLTESVSIAFKRIKWTYFPIDPKSGKPGTKVETGWDVTTRKNF